VTAVETNIEVDLQVDSKDISVPYEEFLDTFCKLCFTKVSEAVDMKNHFCSSVFQASTK
jgi:hypothetical protein